MTRLVFSLVVAILPACGGAQVAPDTKAKLLCLGTCAAQCARTCLVPAPQQCADQNQAKR
jgi:hypothetical protein